MKGKYTIQENLELALGTIVWIFAIIGFTEVLVYLWP